MPRYRHGLANAIIIFIFSLAAAALIIAALNSPFDSVIATAGTVGTSEEAQVGRNIVTTAWDLAPIITVLLGLIYVIGSAATESNV
jgi:hypothetical protein